jgi:large subunit ribosomal protein L10
MPNQIKIDQVEKSTDRLKEASGIYFASYTGMNVNQATEFRKICRETNVDYSITKNTLIKIAAKNAGYESQFNELLKGQIAIATSIEDPVAPARIIKDFNEKNDDVLKVVGVYVEGSLYDADKYKVLAELPTREQMIAKFASMLNQPMTKLAGTLSSTMTKLVGTLASLKEQKQ